MSREYISIADREYGLRRLKRKVERLKKKLKRLNELNEIKSLSLHGAEELGRINETIYIYEDLIDLWEN